MEQILKDLAEEVLRAVNSELQEEEISQMVEEYYEKLVKLMPKPMSVEQATYSNEASYIRGWNACVEKMASIQ